jgi:hypothetical protein
MPAAVEDLGHGRGMGSTTFSKIEGNDRGEFLQGHLEFLAGGRKTEGGPTAEGKGDDEQQHTARINLEHGFLLGSAEILMMKDAV